jgi:hypothetical protein
MNLKLNLHKLVLLRPLTSFVALCCLRLSMHLINLKQLHVQS